MIRADRVPANPVLLAVMYLLTRGELISAPTAPAENIRITVCGRESGGWGAWSCGYGLFRIPMLQRVTVERGSAGTISRKNYFAPSTIKEGYYGHMALRYESVVLGLWT